MPAWLVMNANDGTQSKDTNASFDLATERLCFGYDRADVDLKLVEHVEAASYRIDLCCSWSFRWSPCEAAFVHFATDAVVFAAAVDGAAILRTVWM